MKIKYFLRGLGIGIVLTALVLCITYRSGEKNEKSVVEQAKELGMVFPEGTSTPEEILPEVTDEPVSGEAVEPEEVTNTPKPTDTPKPTGKPTKTPKPTATPKKEDVKYITFTVREGLLSSSVAREMKEAGVIKDADAFDEFIEENGYGRLIRSGKYKIPVGASYETIAKIITRQD